MHTRFAAGTICLPIVVNLTIEFMLIAVTQKHIDEGKRRHCHRCPVALALREATDRSDIEVLSKYAGVPSGWSWNLPYEAQKSIDDFDMGRPVKPFEFQID